MAERRRSRIIDPGESVGHRPRSVRRSMMRTVGPYAVLATVWIFSSDLITRWLIGEADQMAVVSIVKGVGFVAVTSLLLALLVRNDLTRLHHGLMQQRLLAQGTEALRGAESAAEAWHDLARVIRIHAGFGYAELWSPVDPRTLTLATIDGIAPARLERPVPSAGNIPTLSADDADLSWLWDISDDTGCLVCDGTELAECGAALPADAVVRVVIDGVLTGAIMLSSDEPHRLAPHLVEPMVYLVRRLEETLERFRLKASVAHSILYDDLTDLPNRLLLIERLRAAIKDADATGARFVAFALELDIAERIRQSLGHEQHDRLIADAAERLRSVLGPRDTLARTQTSEFVILGRYRQRSDIADYLGKLRDATAAPVELDGATVPLSLSIGVHVFGAGSGDQDVLTSAASALSHAHLLGRGRTVFFDQAMRVSVEDALALEVDLKNAIAEGGLIVEYQPIVRASDGTVSSAEALVRWNHPERGLLYPGSFIPLAEESGLIVDIGRHMLRVACEDCASWPDASAAVAVNLSAIEFTDPDLRSNIRGALVASGLAPERLIVEITETTLMTDPEAAGRTLKALGALGVRIALDDFGTGYSSLSYLQKLDIDILKIDGSFVSGIPDNEENVAFTRAIIQLASSLGLHTVAEAVEDERQAQHLAAEGCDYLQGYLYARPMPSADLAAWMTMGDARRS